MGQEDTPGHDRQKIATPLIQPAKFSSCLRRGACAGHSCGVERLTTSPQSGGVKKNILPSLTLLAALVLSSCRSPEPEPRPGTISINTGGIGGPNIQIGGIDNDDATPATIDID